MKVCPHCRTEYGDDVRVCPNDGARLDAPMPVVDALVGQVLAERYRIIRTIGEGGMGRVYLAEHVRMGRLSAVKVMSPSLAPTADAIGRFNREAANASRINHPGVAAIYDFGETADGTMYLAMEFVEGENLASLLRRDGPLDIERAADLAQQIAAGLNAAHQLGIVHRDLKPDNILVTKDVDGVERTKVVDFGIAKAVKGGGQTVTTAGVSIGTPEYMSPEQFAGGDVDFRTDIYSLGLVVYGMLTNRLPFPELSSTESLVQRLTTRPRPLAETTPNIAWPLKLQRALDRALSPDPEERYQKVLEFAGDVSAAARDAHAHLSAQTRPMTPMHVPTAPRVSASPRRDDDVAQASAPTKRSAPLTASSGSKGPMIGAAAVVVLAAAAFGFWKFNAPFAAADGRVATSTSVDSARARTDTQAVATPAAAVPASPSVTTPDSASRTSAGVPMRVSKVAEDPKPKTPEKVLAPRTTAPAAAVVAAQPAPARSDSLAAAATVAALGPRPKRAGEHAFLTANGDSASAGGLAAAPIVTETREVMGHIKRAGMAFNTRQPGKATNELRYAFEEYSMFALDHPGTRETTMLGQQLRGVVMNALTGCQAALAAGNTNVKASQCDALVKAQTMLAQTVDTTTSVPSRPFRRRGQRPLR